MDLSCGPSLACGAGLFCDSDSSTCQAYGMLGDLCSRQPCLPNELYCRRGVSVDRCAAFGTVVGASCARATDGGGCVSGLTCRLSDETCQALPTGVGESCSVDGCASKGDGQQLYCRSSDATCQLRSTTIGTDCRADPSSACGTATAADGTSTPLYCSAPSYLCAAKLGAGASCASNPAQACADPYYCSSNNDICISQVITEGDNCNADPYAQCGLDPSLAYPGYNGQLYPLVQVDQNGDQVCTCARSPGPTSVTPVPGTFGLTSVGDDCSGDPTFACGYTQAGVKLYCALSTNTCQTRVTTVGGSCAYDYLGACGKTQASNGDFVQLFPSIPLGSSGHAACTCVLEADVALRPSSRARARARARRNLSLCPESHTACPVGNGFECIDTTSNIEQCGGCSGDSSSVDCSALEGVAAVGCVDGRCEIWACENGFAFSPEEGKCARA